MKILMIGATGNFAKHIIPALKEKNIKIKALVRNDKKGENALENGADETVVGDLNNIDSLRNAVKDINGVFYLNPVFVENEVEMGLNMVKAAREAEIEKFVFSSVYHPSLSLGNHAAKRPVEEALYESNIKFVILQPAIFMQTIGENWTVIKQTKKVALPYSKWSRMSYVDYRDVADVVAIAFIDNKLDHGTFELSSDGMYDRNELADIIGKTLKIKVEAKEISFEDFAKKTEMPEGFAKNELKTMFEHYDQFGFHGGNSLILETIIGRRPRTLTAYFNSLER
ncbi:NmrA family NAD(P)-binding protein [Sinomicrobium kalidii]|uniref:SDR family oxidoreductase n=1 Tax=Sinomicrobium kalidii TaxID=2900738 RepID=UPI001E624AD9|nr:NmrA family NAD(P)-binding protein [Sinomicrobium kalidii]UGU17970.1 NmrA family NAD(P)-binding protein [Sinomicrobium kalidii]